MILEDLPRQTIPTDDELRDVVVDSGVLAYVDLLDSPSFTQREEASRQLVEVTADRLQLYALLKGGDLSAEQRYRVLDVLRELLLKTPRGAVGIRMQPIGFGAGAQELRVEELIPGLPAERFLHLGDRITHVDGHPIKSNEDLTIRVQSKRPGEKVVLNIKRTKRTEQGETIQGPDGEPIIEEMTVEFPLGSADMLDKVQGQFGQGQFGQLTQSRGVLQQRQDEARRACATLAPDVRSIPVKGGEAALLD